MADASKSGEDFQPQKGHKNTQKKEMTGIFASRLGHDRRKRQPEKTLRALNRVIESDFCASFAPFCG